MFLKVLAKNYYFHPKNSTSLNIDGLAINTHINNRVDDTYTGITIANHNANANANAN